MTSSRRLSHTDYMERLRSVRLLATDVDGVLTDGSIQYVGAEAEAKTFHVRDGSGMHIAALIELPVLVITARRSDAVERRFAELPILELRQGVFDKLSVCEEIETRLGIEPREVAYLGDDLVDLPAMRHVGLAIAVSDGNPMLVREADWVTRRGGGRGALREVVDDIVTARGMWDRVLADYVERQGLERTR